MDYFNKMMTILPAHNPQLSSSFSLTNWRRDKAVRDRGDGTWWYSRIITPHWLNGIYRGIPSMKWSISSAAISDSIQTRLY